MKYLILFFTLSLGFQLNAQISEDGLMAYYPFNGDVLDYGPSGFHGLMNGGLFADDEPGNANSALYLDGINDYINLSAFAPTFRDQLGEVSIYFKVKFEETTDQQTILSLGNHGENLFTNVFEIEYENNQIQVETETANAAINHEFGIDQPTWVADQEWHTVLIILHGDSLRYCRDGIELYHDIYIPAETTTLSLFLGCFGGTSTNDCCYFGGFIDELQFYNRVLPNKESYITLEACPETSISYNGVELLSGSITQFAYPSENCCDSIVTVEVIPLQGTEEQVTVETCDETPITFDGVTLNAGSLTPFTYTTSEGCDSVVTVQVSSYPPILGFLGPDINSCGERVTLNSLVDNTTWSDGTIGPVRQIDEAGIFTANYTDSLGCVQYDTIEVRFLAQKTFVPNAFSPNGDGVNDCFRSYSSDPASYLEYELQIFNRWGAMVYSSTDAEACWDGSFQGKSLDPDIFAWRMRITSTECDAAVTREGDILLLR